MLIEATYILLAGLANRIRGGLFGDKIRKVLPFYGTTEGRLIYSIYISSFYLYLGTTKFHLAGAALTVGTVFLGHAIKGFSPWQFMMTKDDIWKMSLRGLALTGLIALSSYLVLGFGGAIIIALGGLLMGPIYFLSQRAPQVSYLNDIKENASNNDLAEILFGFVLAGLIVGGAYYGGGY